jgi:pyruvate/2-oxoglutarate dehydrogenase complex dihydrolipoamide dehydrogenase (E3) component
MTSYGAPLTTEETDVVVLGLGPGGEDAATRLARAGLAVVAVEDRLVGGECPYWGCIPSKMMIRAAGLLTEGRRIPGMAGDSVITPSWAPVARRIRDEATDSWDDKVAADRLTAAGVTLLRGHGTITGPREVTVTRPGSSPGGDGTGSAGAGAGAPWVVRARRGVLVNTGTVPAIPPVPGMAGTPYWTSHEAIETEQVPGSLIVLGGGAVGCELAQVFARFGSEVQVAEAAGQLLPAEEPESGALLAEVFGREGIGVHTECGAEQVDHKDGRFTVRLGNGTELTAERLLVATGRRADLAAFGAAAAGLDEKARFVRTDGHQRAAPGVWAIGDITGQGAFTHMSMYQAGIAVADILGQPHHAAETHAVPRVTFTDPEIGSVGLTEAQARDQGLAVRVGRTQVPESARGWIHKAGNDGFIKVIEDAGRGVLAGATSAGPAGGEVLSMLVLAVHAAVPVRRLREMIYAYPAFHRAVESALDDLAGQDGP